MDTEIQYDIWKLANELSRDRNMINDPKVNKVKEEILDKYPEIKSAKWTSILLITRYYPGIEGNSLCEKARVLMSELNHMEEIDSEQLLLKITRRGDFRFYNLGDWGIFWLVLNDIQEEREQEENAFEREYITSSIDNMETKLLRKNIGYSANRVDIKIIDGLDRALTLIGNYYYGIDADHQAENVNDFYISKRFNSNTPIFAYNHRDDSIQINNTYMTVLERLTQILSINEFKKREFKKQEYLYKE